MSIPRLIPNKPPVSSTDSTTPSSSVSTDTNFQGRNVSVAGQQQSPSFLPVDDRQHATHILPSKSGYMSARNITTSKTDSNQISESHDYEQIPDHDYDEIKPTSNDYEDTTPKPNDYLEIIPPSNDYEEIDSPSDDYEDMGQQPTDYEDMGPQPTDYEDMGPQPTDYEDMGPQPTDYEDMGPQPTNYEDMGPQPTDYEDMTPQPNDYEEITPPNDYEEIDSGHVYDEIPANSKHISTDSTYLATRSVVDSPETAQPTLKHSELKRIRQTSSECADYIKELKGDLQKAMQCVKNLETTSKNDMVALRNYVIPQHVNCIGDYSKAVQTLLNSGRHAPAQRRYLEESSRQLAVVRVKLLETQGIIGEAIQAKNFSTEAGNGYANLTTERESPAGQLMATQSKIMDIHKNSGEIKSRVKDLGNMTSPSGSRGEAVLREISACRRDVVGLKSELAQCIAEIKTAMDTINSYEARIKEQPDSSGTQRTLRERRYTMRLSRRLETQARNINGTLTDSWQQLQKMS